MIVLDTKVISEIMRPEPDAGVKSCLAAQDNANNCCGQFSSSRNQE